MLYAVCTKLLTTQTYLLALIAFCCSSFALMALEIIGVVDPFCSLLTMQKLNAEFTHCPSTKTSLIHTLALSYLRLLISFLFQSLFASLEFVLSL